MFADAKVVPHTVIPAHGGADRTGTRHPPRGQRLPPGQKQATSPRARRPKAQRGSALDAEESHSHLLRRLRLSFRNEAIASFGGGSQQGGLDPRTLAYASKHKAKRNRRRSAAANARIRRASAATNMAESAYGDAASLLDYTHAQGVGEHQLCCNRPPSCPAGCGWACIGSSRRGTRINASVLSTASQRHIVSRDRVKRHSISRARRLSAGRAPGSPIAQHIANAATGAPDTASSAGKWGGSPMPKRPSTVPHSSFRPGSEMPRGGADSGFLWDCALECSCCVDSCCCCKVRSRMTPTVLAAARRSSIAQALTLGAADSHSTNPRSPGGISLDDSTVEECSCCADGATCGPDGCCGPYGCMGPMVRSFLFVWRILSSLAELLIGHCLVRVGGETFWVVHPDRRWRWDLVVMLLVLYVAWETPFTQAFEPNWEWSRHVGIFIDSLFFIDVFVNARSAFWTPERKLEIRTWPVFCRYATTWMLIDFASCVPFDLLIDSGLLDTTATAGTGETGGLDVRLVSGLKAVRLFRLHRLAKVLSHLQNSSMFGIIRLYGAILLIGHWLACLWYVVTIGAQPGGVGETWALNAGINGYIMVSSHDLDSDEALISNLTSTAAAAAASMGVTTASSASVAVGASGRLLASNVAELPMYVPSTTATGAGIATQTIAPGQEHPLRPIIRPARASSLWYNYVTSLVEVILALFRTQRFRATTIPESLFLLFLVLIGAALQAVVFGQVAFLVSKLNSARSAFDQQMSDVRDRMRYNKLPESLIHRVTDYYERQFETHRLPVGQSDPVSWVKLIGNEPLSNELSLFVHKDLILKVDIFRGASADVVLKIVKALRSTLYLPGDYVVKLGEVGSEMFFIRSGECMVLLPVAEDASEDSSLDGDSDGEGLVIPGMRTAKTLGAGAAFGELALLFSTERTATVVSSTYSDLSALAAEDFDRILEENMEFGILLMRNFQTYIQRDYQSGSATVVPSSVMDLPDARPAGASGEHGIQLFDPVSGVGTPRGPVGESSTVPFAAGGTAGYTAVESRLLSSGGSHQDQQQQGASQGSGMSGSSSYSDASSRSSSKSHSGSSSSSYSSSSSLSSSSSSYGKHRHRRHRRSASASTSRSGTGSGTDSSSGEYKHRRRHSHGRKATRGGVTGKSAAAASASAVLSAAKGVYTPRRDLHKKMLLQLPSSSEPGDESETSSTSQVPPLTGQASRTVMQLAVQSIVRAKRGGADKTIRTKRSANKSSLFRAGPSSDSDTARNVFEISATGICAPSSEAASDDAQLTIRAEQHAPDRLPPVPGAISNPSAPGPETRRGTRSSLHDLATAPTEKLRRRRRSSLLAALHAADGIRPGASLTETRPSFGGSHAAMLSAAGKVRRPSGAQGPFPGVRSGRPSIHAQLRDAAALRNMMGSSSGGGTSGSSGVQAGPSYGSVMSVHSASDLGTDSQRGSQRGRGHDDHDDDGHHHGRSHRSRRKAAASSSRHRHKSKYGRHRHDKHRSLTTGTHRRRSRSHSSGGSDQRHGNRHRHRDRRAGRGHSSSRHRQHHHRGRSKGSKHRTTAETSKQAAPANESTNGDVTIMSSNPPARKPPPAPPRTSTGPIDETEVASTPADKVASLFVTDGALSAKTGGRDPSKRTSLPKPPAPSRSISPKAPASRALEFEVEGAATAVEKRKAALSIPRPASTTPRHREQGRRAREGAGGVVWKEQAELGQMQQSHQDAKAQRDGAVTVASGLSGTPRSPGLASRKSKSAHDLKGLIADTPVHPAVNAVAAAARHTAQNPPSTGGSEATVPSAVGRSVRPDAGPSALRSIGPVTRGAGAGNPAMARVLSFKLTAQQKASAGGSPQSKGYHGAGAGGVQRLFRANSMQQGGASVGSGAGTQGGGMSSQQQQGSAQVAALSAGAAPAENDSAVAMAHVQQMMEALAMAKGSSLGANVIPRQSVLRGLTNATRVLGRLPGVLEVAPSTGQSSSVTGAGSATSMRPPIIAQRAAAGGSGAAGGGSGASSVPGSGIASHHSLRDLPTDATIGPSASEVPSKTPRGGGGGRPPRDGTPSRRQRLSAVVREAAHVNRMMHAAGADNDGAPLLAAEMASTDMDALLTVPGAANLADGEDHRTIDARDRSGSSASKHAHDGTRHRSPSNSVRERHHHRHHRHESKHRGRHRSSRDRHRDHRSRSRTRDSNHRHHKRRSTDRRSNSGERDNSRAERRGSSERDKSRAERRGSSEKDRSRAERRGSSERDKSRAERRGSSEARRSQSQPATDPQLRLASPVARHSLTKPPPVIVNTGRGRAAHPMRLMPGDRSLSSPRDSSSERDGQNLSRILHEKAGRASGSGGSGSGHAQAVHSARNRRHSAPKHLNLSLGEDAAIGFASQDMASQIGDSQAGDSCMEVGADRSIGAEGNSRGNHTGRNSIKAVQQLLSTPPSSPRKRQSLPGTDHLRKAIKSPEFLKLLQGDARRRRLGSKRIASPRYSSHTSGPGGGSRLSRMHSTSESADLDPRRTSKLGPSPSDMFPSTDTMPDATALGPRQQTSSKQAVRGAGSPAWGPQAASSVTSDLSESGVRRVVREELAKFRQSLLRDLAAMMAGQEAPGFRPDATGSMASPPAMSLPVFEEN